MRDPRLQLTRDIPIPGCLRYIDGQLNNEPPCTSSEIQAATAEVPRRQGYTLYWSMIYMTHHFSELFVGTLPNQIESSDTCFTRGCPPFKISENFGLESVFNLSHTRSGDKFQTNNTFTALSAGSPGDATTNFNLQTR